VVGDCQTDPFLDTRGRAGMWQFDIFGLVPSAEANTITLDQNSQARRMGCDTCWVLDPGRLQCTTLTVSLNEIGKGLCPEDEALS
jgi:hypothetical protein